jgi:adenine-specific DNA methylase
VIPLHPKIETINIPIKWLYKLAICEGNSKKPIYQIHKWWARRLSSVFRALLLLATTPSDRSIDEFINNYYEKHDLNSLTVLDPFMGGGTSVIESSKVNAKVLGIDIDPIAWFVTKKELEPFSELLLTDSLQYLERTVGKEIQSYYLTKTPDGLIASVIYYFWVDLISCPKCQCTFEAHHNFILSEEKNKNLKTVFCSKCHQVIKIPSSQSKFICELCGEVTEINTNRLSKGIFTCPYCAHRASILSIIQPGEPLKKRLFAVEYEAENKDGKLCRYYKSADDYDIELYEKANRKLKEFSEELWYPKFEIPLEDRSDPRPINHGYKYYFQLFNSRQLLCLSLLWKEIVKINDIQTREYLMLSFSDALTCNNLLCRYASGYQKLTPLFGLHAYDVVSRPVENNVWGSKYGRGSFIKCVNKMIKGKKYGDRPYELRYDTDKPERVYTEEKITSNVTTDLAKWNFVESKCLLNKSALILNSLKSSSIDLILTDPPYYDNLSYSELSDFFYVWLREYLPKDENRISDVSTPYKTALYVNGITDRDRFIFELSSIFSQCRRVLKENGLMVFTFHHRKAQAWEALAKALWEANIKITNVFPVRSEGKSGFHSTIGTIKWDSVLICRPKESDILTADDTGFTSILQTRLEVWENLLKGLQLDFQWIDALSLGYSLGVQLALTRAMDNEQLGNLVKETQNLLLSRLSTSQLKLVA